MGPHLGKLVNMHTLGLDGRRCSGLACCAAQACCDFLNCLQVVALRPLAGEAFFKRCREFQASTW